MIYSGTWPQITGNDVYAVATVLSSENWSGYDHPSLLTLEERFAELHSKSYAMGFNGGTAAIHAALYALGVAAGDEVIMPVISFSGSYQPVLSLGAEPVFVDVDPATFNMCPLRLREAITERTKVIMPVHLHGNPADMKPIMEIADAAGVAVLEDACQAHLAKVDDRLVGTIGAVGCFSLNQTKHLPAGEGGILLTDDAELNERVGAFRVFGESLPDGEKINRGYNSRHLGLNLIMPGMTAALAVSQLDRLEGNTIRAITNGEYLSRKLSDCDGCLPPVVQQGGVHVYHKYRLIIDEFIDREDFVKTLQAAGVPATLWQVRIMSNYDQFVGHNMGSFPMARRVLRHSVIIGDEKHPIIAQNTDTLDSWSVIIKSTLSEFLEALT